MPLKQKRSQRQPVPFEGSAVEADDEDLDSDEEEAAELRGRETQQKFEEEEHDTVEQKRLWLATKYLGEVVGKSSGDAQDQADDDENEDDDDDDEGSDPEDNSVSVGARKLKRARLAATGRSCSRVANSLLPHASALLRLSPFATNRDADGGNHPYRWMTGHQLPLTCVCVSPDDRHCFTGGKDNALIQYDVETGQRVGYIRRAWQRGAESSGGAGSTKARHGEILCVSTSGDGRLLASGGRDKLVRLYDMRALQAVDVAVPQGGVGGEGGVGGLSHTSTGGRGTRAFELRSFRGHKDAVTGVAFQQGGGAAGSGGSGAGGGQTLFSGSLDRTLKLWDVKDMGFLDTLYGHQSEINGLDVLQREVAVTTGRDCSARLWKWSDDKQLVFRGASYSNSIECVRMLSEDTFVTGDDSGQLAIWHHLKKKPAMSVDATVAPNSTSDTISSTTKVTPRERHPGRPWVVSLASTRGADLVASGSSDGFVRLWKALGVDGGRRSLVEVAAVPMPGFVNGLALSGNGKLLFAATGQEHRLGRWDRIQGGGARNALAVVALPVGEGD